MTEETEFVWRGDVDNAALEALHGEGFGHEPVPYGWRAQLERHSLGWVCARRLPSGRLVGFVNVAWDGGGHAFLVDTVVAADARRSGIGAGLVAVAVREARAAGCEWLHVDFDDHLRPFYFDACGFRPTDAGLIALKDAPEAPEAPDVSPSH
ncbi:GNAT family N-acetyltransferase [Streptomyces sp. 6N223]|uniref:GNAT family N-acetyltransferase n=1 Tax=Streptomyces sp. 6N223 TaxID=3457412 RepID=UPI003FD49BFD